CSPNGFTVAFHTNFSSTDYIYSLDLRAPQFSAGYATAPSGTTFGRPSFAPDGNSIYFAATSSATSAIENQIISSPSSLHAVASYPAASESIYDVSCSPYFAAKTFIGAGGLMSSAAGFLWTQRGDGFGSFASFSATTPSKLTITQQNSGGSGGALVYLAKADVITKIVYTNDYFGAYSGIASTGSQALISVSATTGQIDTVAPLTEPGLQRLSRGGTSYEGRFTAVYDAHGKNLARSGASHIELDPKTGAVTSWR
ncbi:MAG TPA: hypothetical protein VG944_06250, partial [Fimbriimonas sp.]|nr:hypothetical protein [Fimbriimonas sp.]